MTTRYTTQPKNVRVDRAHIEFRPIPFLLASAHHDNFRDTPVECGDDDFGLADQYGDDHHIRHSPTYTTHRPELQDTLLEHLLPGPLPLYLRNNRPTTLLLSSELYQQAKRRHQQQTEWLPSRRNPEASGSPPTQTPFHLHRATAALEYQRAAERTRGMPDPFTTACGTPMEAEDSTLEQAAGTAAAASIVEQATEARRRQWDNDSLDEQTDNRSDAGIILRGVQPEPPVPTKAESTVLERLRTPKGDWTDAYYDQSESHGGVRLPRGREH